MRNAAEITILANLVPDSTTFEPIVLKLLTIPPTKLVPKLTVAWRLAPTVVNGGACGGFVTNKGGCVTYTKGLLVGLVVVIVVRMVVVVLVVEEGVEEDALFVVESEFSVSPKRLNKTGGREKAGACFPLSNEASNFRT